MHEISLIRDLLAKVDSVVRAHGGSRAVSVDVWLGALSHLSPDRFSDHFTTWSTGTTAEGAWLDLELSEDPDDPNAQSILLRHVEVALPDSSEPP